MVINPSFIQCVIECPPKSFSQNEIYSAEYDELAAHNEITVTKSRSNPPDFSFSKKALKVLVNFIVEVCNDLKETEFLWKYIFKVKKNLTNKKVSAQSCKDCFLKTVKHF